MLKKILCLVVCVSVVLSLLIVPSFALGSSVESDSTYPYYYTNDFVWDLQYTPVLPLLYDVVNDSATTIYYGDEPLYYGTYVDRVNDTYFIIDTNNSMDFTENRKNHFIKPYRYGASISNFSLTVPTINDSDPSPDGHVSLDMQAYFGGYSSTSADNAFRYNSVSGDPVLYARDMVYRSADSMFIAGTNQIYDEPFKITFVVPSGLDFLFADNYELGLDLLDRDFVYSVQYEFEYLTFDYDTYSWEWTSVIDSFSVGLGEPISTFRGYVSSAEYVDEWYGAWAVANHYPNGVGYLDFRIPLNSILYSYVQDYSNNTGFNESGIFVRNLKIMPELKYSLDRVDYYESLSFNETGGTNASAGTRDLFDVQTYGNHYLNGALGNLFAGFYYRTNYHSNPIETALDKYNSLVSSVTITEVGLENFNFVSWIGDTLGGIFDIDIFGTFSLGDVLGSIVAVFFVIIILKFFAGG